MKKLFMAAVCAAALAAWGAEVRMLETGGQVPELAGAWSKGDPVKFAEQRGKNAVVLYFWAVNQSALQDMPRFAEFARKYQGKPVVFVGIGCDRADRVSGFFRARELPMPVLIDDRSAIRNLDGSQVQVYDRTLGGKYYYIFFDLKDLLREAGASESELAALQSALDKVLVYEAHTTRFIDIPLKRCCGLAMYLPAFPDYKADPWHGTAFLDSFYKEHVTWNAATALVD